MSQGPTSTHGYQARPAAFRLLTADEVAAILRVGRSTVYEWARRGDLPSVVLHRGRGRNVRRWEPSAIDAFIARGRVLGDRP